MDEAELVLQTLTEFADDNRDVGTRQDLAFSQVRRRYTVYVIFNAHSLIAMALAR